MTTKSAYVMPSDETDESDFFMVVTWSDPLSTAIGWLAIYNLPGNDPAKGLCTGGTRMRDGCTLPEVKALAFGMSQKAATFGLPVGGAKGGINYDPKAPDAQEVLERFLAAMRPFLDTCWVTAEDLGVSQQDIDKAFQKLGLGQSFHAAIQRSDDPVATLERVHAGMTALVDGTHEIGDVAGGYGVAQSCFGVIDAMNWNITDTTAAVQGVGTMGGGAAWYLHQAGVKIIALSDAQGTLYDESGLNVPDLLNKRDANGEIDRTKINDPGIEDRDRTAILSLTVDILVPAAISNTITAMVADSVMASVVIEAANNPTTPDAEKALLHRDIPVVPDFVANAGAAAWAWWLLQGRVGTDTKAVLDTLKSEIRPKAVYLIEVWKKDGTMPRVTATQEAARILASNQNKTIFIP